jgi:hypothetical protein
MDSPIAFYPVETRPFTVRAARLLLNRFLFFGLLCILASGCAAVLGGTLDAASSLFLYGLVATGVAAYLYVLTLDMRDDDADADL